MDYEKYKNRLIEYLKKKGFDARIGLISCFSPFHEDKNPSCELFSDHFVCYSGKCGIKGDIYDAVEILEGITDRKEQYLRIEKLFSNSAPSFFTADKQKNNFTPDAKAAQRVESYMQNHPGKDRATQQFLSARTKTLGGQYPPAISLNLVKDFLYWPGLEIARKSLGNEVLRLAGIPLTHPVKGYSTWDHSGIVVKLSIGYKLHYYENRVCKKINSKSGSAFPMPGTIDYSRPVILVEGELDALAMRASGFKNVYAAGGTKGITGPKIKKNLLSAKEIIILYDNDEAGKKTMGLIPIEPGEKRTCLPDSLEKNGFSGIIKIAVLPSPYKDADDVVRNDAIEVLKKTLAAASEYIPKKEEKKAEKPAVEQDDNKNMGAQGKLSLKELQGFLKKIKKDDLDVSEVNPFVSACWNILESPGDSAWKMLHKWGAPDEILDKPGNQNPSYLVTIGKKYDISRYFIRRLENVTMTKDRLKKLISKKEPAIKVDKKKITEWEKWRNFIQDNGTKTGSEIIEEILKDCFIFVETDKRHYLYDGHVWIREPDPRGLVYNIFSSLLKYNLEKCSEFDDFTIRALEKTAKKIEQYRFRSEVVLDLSSSPSVFRDDVLFDGPAIRETLTLEDGVLDFSDKQIKFRKSIQEEYRREKLPYTVNDIENAESPEKFMNFMESNFQDHETMETLLFYLSLIPSRQTQYKYGGIFIGRPHTGKTTTIELIMKIYTGMIVRLPSDVLVSVSKRGGVNNGPNPYIARLESKGAAVAQETERNGYLNGALWKELTGGDTLTARGMYSAPRDFTPTAQIIMASNHSPRFDSKDQATIDRMVVVPFRVEHKHGSKETRELTDIISDLEPEFPSVVRLLADYYISLKHHYKGAIPLSKECAAYKSDYVQDQETDLDRFVEDNIDFIKDENCYETIKDVYRRYLSYYNFTWDEFGKPLDKEAWTQNKFTRFLKHDYTEIRVKQKKINGYPEQIFLFTKLRPINETTNTKENKGEDINERIDDFNDAPPEENPFG